MPLINIVLTEGRTPETRERLIKEVTDAVAETLEIPVNRVWVVIDEVRAENWGVGGLPLSKK
ncbi:MAG: tautomerase family protein [Bacillota bacterium]